MLKNIFAFFFFALLAAFSIQPAYAGGVAVAAYADPSGSVNNDGLYGRVIRAYINPILPCKDTQVTFMFNVPQDGDYVMTASGNATYAMEERTSNGCTIYAKMGSKVKGAREISVDAKNGATRYTGWSMTVDFDGQYHGDDLIYRSSLDDPFGGNSYGNTLPTQTTYPVPVGTLTVTVLSQQPDPLNNRTVVIKWSVLESSQAGWSVFYDIYGRPAHDTEWHNIRPDQAGPSATLTIGAHEDYYIKVQGCIRKWGNCVDSNVLLLPKVRIENGTLVTGKPIQTISSTPSGNNQKVDELDKKVASLEGKLAESQKKQNVLEQKISDLIALFKRLFPFLNQK